MQRFHVASALRAALLVVAHGNDAVQTLDVVSTGPLEQDEAAERSRRPIVSPSHQGVIEHRSKSIVRAVMVDDRAQVPLEQRQSQSDDIHPDRLQVDRKMVASVVRRSVAGDGRVQIPLEQQPSQLGPRPDRPQVEGKAVASVERSVMVDDKAQMPLGQRSSQPNGVQPNHPQLERMAVASDGDVSLSRITELASEKGNAYSSSGANFLVFVCLAFLVVAGGAVLMASRQQLQAASSRLLTADYSPRMPSQSRSKARDVSKLALPRTCTEDDLLGRSTKARSKGACDVGDRVKIIKEESSFQGQTAVVTEFYDRPIRIRVRMDTDGSIKSYFFEEVMVVD